MPILFNENHHFHKIPLLNAQGFYRVFYEAILLSRDPYQNNKKNIFQQLFLSGGIIGPQNALILRKCHIGGKFIPPNRNTF